MSTMLPSLLHALDLGLRVQGQPVTMPGGRLTLVSGQPVYAPEKTLTPSATNTTADTVDFAAAHGWVSGTAVTVSATAGGLATFTIYYINATDTDTLSFHTTAVAALAGTGKVDLTATITATITAIGVGASTLYYTPYLHNRIRVYDGNRWMPKTFAESSSMLNMTSGKVYDVFLDDDAATLMLSGEWTSATVRANALATQDGVTVLAGDPTKLWLGTIYLTAALTNTVESTESRRGVWNAYNRVPRRIFRDLSGSGAYNTATIRQWFASADAQIELVCGMQGPAAMLSVTAQLQSDASSGPRIGLGDNSTTTFIPGSFFDSSGSPTTLIVRGVGVASVTPRVGFSVYSLNQINASGTGVTSFGSGRMFGLWEA